MQAPRALSADKDEHSAFEIDPERLQSALEVPILGCQTKHTECLTGSLGDAGLALPGLPSAVSLPGLPSGALPSLPILDGGLPLASGNLPSLPSGSLPSLPTPSLPTVDGGLLENLPTPTRCTLELQLCVAQDPASAMKCADDARACLQLP